MKPNILAMIKAGALSCVFLLLGVLLIDSGRYPALAKGGSVCSHAANCHLLDGAGNTGSFENGTAISHIIIKAGLNFVNVGQGSSQEINGCYLVNLSGSYVDWQKIGSGRDCKDISHIQVWSRENQNYPDDKEDPDTPELPSFPACVEQKSVGDYVHYDFGVHQIVGDGLLEGSDDVYTVEGGNYLQCYCSQDKTRGIETLWWQVGELERDLIDLFESQGWFYLNGSQWNLGDYWYLAKNVEYNCSQPTPTPTVELTPTPTPTPTPTTTPGDEPESRCSGLSASPKEGSAPLTVRFDGSGFDEDGKIKKYRFVFGDSSGGQPGDWEQESETAYHRYEFPGEYFASLHVQDSRGNWRNGGGDCKVKITVKETPKVLGLSTVTSLPETGATALIGLGLALSGSLGVYLYKRFRLV